MIAGVDGTSQGWIAVLCDDDLGNLRACFIERLTELPHELRVAAVDVPMGLPDRGAREADHRARQALGEPRRKSVFPCPIRPALGAHLWEEACTRTERVEGRRISKQTFGILRKVEETDRLIRSESWARRIFHEVHPELSFAKWAGRPMTYKKKHPAGREERLKLLNDVIGPRAFETALETIRGHYIARDDLADAFAAVWTASRIVKGNAERLPERWPEPVDSKGVSMHIWV